MQRVRLEGLATWGQQLLAQLGWEEGGSKRVTWTPTPRLIRYYTTLGLVDRPAGFEGRAALYGPRHLLQVLAIKRLQLDGKSLDEVQPWLLGRSDADLAAILGVTLPLPDPVGTAPVVPQVAERPANFWEAVPAPRAPAGRPVIRFEPLPGVEVLIDPDRLPAGHSPDSLMSLIAQACRPTS